MKIVKLTLKGYKRLLLNNIKELVYTATSPYQIILGRNGSGKSSLLHELTPLPALPANYVRGGLKEIVIEHKNSTYVLTSVMAATPRHSFMKDNEYLVRDGTMSMQRDMVRREFGITPEIRSLLLGEEKFTAMTPAKRREWFTLLSDTDLTYATSTYNALRRQARDVLGAYRHVSNRLTTETNKLMAIEDAKELEERARQIRDELTLLMENRVPGLPTYHSLEQSLAENLRQLEETSRSLISIAPNAPPGYHFDNREEVVDAIQECRAEITVTESLLKKAVEEHGELEKLVETIQAHHVGSIDDLKVKLTELSAQRQELLGTVKRFQIDNPQEKVADTNEALPTLRDILSQIPDNSEQRLGRQKIQETQELLNQGRVRLEQLNSQLARARHEIEHLTAAKNSTCPKCGYVWKEGVTEGQVAQLEGRVRELTGQQETQVQENAQREAYLDTAEIWVREHRRFSQLVSHYPRLQLLWDVLVEEQALQRPLAHLPLLAVWERDLQICRRVWEIDQQLQRLRIALESADSNSDGRHLAERLKGLEEEIEGLTGELGRKRKTNTTLTDYATRLRRILDLDVKARELLETVSKQTEELVRVSRNDEISGAIRTHQSALAHMEQRLNEKGNLENLIKDLEQSSKTLETDAKALEMLVSALSPHDGLIAEQLNGSIHALVGQMNEVIGRIWTYDLFIQPCGIDSGELDYRFPLQVRTPENTIPDVGDGSTGQKEIVDFAFQLIAMTYLDLEGYPLYLDELGRTCDEQHRENIVSYLKSLMEARRHSQLFYISHFAFSHGALAGSEVMVLDSANISVPSNHNKHVEIR